MTIDKKDVEHAAHLARLRLSEEEKNQFTSQLAKIIDYVRKLNELDTSGVEPTAHVLTLKNITRPDETKPCLDRGIVLKLAPEAGDGHIRVPKVIE